MKLTDDDFVYAIPSGTNYADAIKALILRAIPDSEFDFTEVKRTTAVKFAWRAESDWIQDADDMACAIGMQLSSSSGVWRLEQLPQETLDDIKRSFRGTFGPDSD
jgi:hypothetical protein